MAIPKLNSYYNYCVYPSPVLVGEVKGAKLTSILDYDAAKKTSVPIIQLNQQIKPYLPEGIPQDITKYTFFRFMKGGEESVIANEWFIPDTMIEVEGRDYSILLRNPNPESLERLRKQMILLGFDFEIN